MGNSDFMIGNQDIIFKLLNKNHNRVLFPPKMESFVLLLIKVR